jgi:hypothetical protein
MRSAGAGSLRSRWIHNANQLDHQGYFSQYPPQQRAEVLRKGFLGSFSPDRAIAVAKEQAQKGYALRLPGFNDQMRDDFGLVNDEVREAVVTILEELPPESYRPPRELEEPPGYPFIFRSRRLQREVYFKFQVKGTAKKPRVLFCACHPPIY